MIARPEAPLQMCLYDRRTHEARVSPFPPNSVRTSVNSSEHTPLPPSILHVLSLQAVIRPPTVFDSMLRSRVVLDLIAKASLAYGSAVACGWLQC